MGSEFFLPSVSEIVYGLIILIGVIGIPAAIALSVIFLTKKK